MDEIHDIDGQLQPEDEPVEGDGVPWGGIAFFIGLALVVVFAVQNTEPVPMTFLWLEGTFAVAIVILVTAVVASLATVAAGAVYRRRRRRRRTEKQQLKSLRDQD